MVGVAPVQRRTEFEVAYDDREETSLLAAVLSGELHPRRAVMGLRPRGQVLPPGQARERGLVDTLLHCADRAGKEGWQR